MHTEHLSNLHFGWIVGGWLIAAAVTSGVYLALLGIGLPPPGRFEVAAISVAIAAGFFVGGLFVGLRWSNAPILHGAAITFFSVVLWFVGSLAVPGGLKVAQQSAPEILGLVLLQLVASIAGGRFGRSLVRGEGPAARE